MKEINNLQATLSGTELYPEYKLVEGQHALPILCLSTMAANCGADGSGQALHGAPNSATQALSTNQPRSMSASSIAPKTNSECCSERPHVMTPSAAGSGFEVATPVMRTSEQHCHTEDTSAAMSAPETLCSSASAAVVQTPVETLPALAHSTRAGCRTCRMVGSGCRLYDRIQWCASKDLPFDVWLAEVYPERKQASRAAAAHRAARATGMRGRPRKAMQIDSDGEHSI